MIGYLEGEIKHYSPGKVLLYSGGIGFKVFIPSSLNLNLNTHQSLYIHTHLRDDDLSLFGFASADDLDLFETLITVSGVGPKTALNIFSQSNTKQIANAIADSNLVFFTSISGIGKKTAQRIILDLKSKISKGDVNMENLSGESELLDSLVSLGFQKSEIQKIISKIDHSADLQIQIKTALKLLRNS